jgi:hypothetical protein
MGAVIEFEAKMAQLGSSLTTDGRELARQVLDLELRNRFGDRSQLPEQVATLALKAVKARSSTGAGS